MAWPTKTYIPENTILGRLFITCNRIYDLCGAAMGMPIRRWELVVDGQTVPPVVLSDEETQAGHTFILGFSGRVYNTDRYVAFAGTEASRGAFVELGGARVVIHLQSEANDTANVWIISLDTRLLRQDEHRANQGGEDVSTI